MKKEKTGRGFPIIYFEDSNGVKCTIQESSAIEDECLIWLGAEEIGLKRFRAGEGWKDIELKQSIPEHHVANNRMHLTQSKVKELLPILQKFADTGEI